MSNKSTDKTLIQRIGAAFFTIAFGIFICLPFLSTYTIDIDAVVANFDNEMHATVVKEQLGGMQNVNYQNPFSFMSDYNAQLAKAQTIIIQKVETELNLTSSDSDYWNQILQDWQIDGTRLQVAKSASHDFMIGSRGLLFFLTFGLGILGALMYILPKFSGIPGIKNNHIFHSSMHNRGWIGISVGVFLVSFYVVLYFYPQYIVNWMILVDPISVFLKSKPADQWFLYGFLYTICILVMGIRMFAKYRHNRYQVVRTSSVMFFQVIFAFLIPALLAVLNMPEKDLKNIWPLDYYLFFEWNINAHLESGTFGIFMFGWSIFLAFVGLPIITYFYGKRWYCSWVCGCGGLAETLGDPYRQLSDKSLNAWKVERWMIHGVLVFAVGMTALTLYTYYSGSSQVLFLDSFQVRSWYGFAIGSMFAGVIGTGFYPWFGNRVWCRMGCPLAAYLGLVQKFKSRFRITVNGGQCISCGNCSTYCEMGIDVRHYAQRGQDVVRSSCVGCGVCAAVCPRGVLRLENGSSDIATRTQELRTIHITEDQISILN